MVELKRCNDQEIWDDYILDNRGHPFQLWGWGQVKASNGWQAIRLFLVDEEEKLGAVQVLVKPLLWPLKSFAYVPRGPVTTKDDREALLILLATYCKKTFGSVALSIEPDELESDGFTNLKGWKRVKNEILPSTTISLDLSKSLDSLTADMSKTTWLSANKALRELGDIRQVKDKATLAECLKIYHETANKSDFALHSDSYYNQVFNDLADNSVIYAAYYDKKPVTFLWLAVSQATAYQMYSGINEIGHDKRANDALRWYCIQKCKEWGIDSYDFGGMIGGDAQKFKKSWSDKETILVGNIEKPLTMWYFLWQFAMPIARNLSQLVKRIIRRFKRA